MGTNRIEIVCGIDRKFIIPCGVMICSLIKTNKRSVFSFHIVHDLEGSLPEFVYLLKYIKENGHKYNLCSVDASRLQGLPLSNHASVANYFRLLFSEILPDTLQKVIYLDSDLVFLGAIDPLWEVDVSNYSVAAVEQQDYNHSYLGLASSSAYFNSGVMLINLADWRVNQVSHKAFEFIGQNKSKIKYWDQDVFNVLFEGKWLKIDRIWNHLDSEDLGESKVVHFAGKHKPWNAHCAHRYKLLYFKYLRLYLSPYSYLKYISKHFGFKFLIKHLVKGR